MKFSDKTSQPQKSTPYLFALRNPFHPACQRLDPIAVPAYWFLFKDNQILLIENDGQLSVPCALEPPIPNVAINYSRCIGIYADSPCMAAELNGTAVSNGNGFSPVSLRDAFAHISGDLWTIAGRASQILQWHQDTRFCSRCGAAMEEQHHEVLKQCSKCGFSIYPRLSPAVIMSVIKDGAILLGRAPRFPQGMYSTLAGFVEPGETLEEAVMREVKEEVNIDIADIRYVASQPWPFPHSLMIGFTARYAGGTIRVNKAELEDADWFRPSGMPLLPPAMSIARKLIDLYLRAALPTDQ